MTERSRLCDGLSSASLVAVAAEPAATEAGLLGTLPSGRAVHVSASAEGERVMVTSRQGTLEVAIRFTDAGPVLELRAAAIDLTAKTIAVRCESLDMQVSGDATTTVDGNLDEHVRGRRRATSAGPTVVAARDLDLSADAGQLRASSRDDLSIQGLNVLINC